MMIFLIDNLIYIDIDIMDDKHNIKLTNNSVDSFILERDYKLDFHEFIQEFIDTMNNFYNNNIAFDGTNYNRHNKNVSKKRYIRHKRRIKRMKNKLRNVIRSSRTNSISIEDSDIIISLNEREFYSLLIFIKNMELQLLLKLAIEI
jgi:hypothetical protein